MILLTYVQADFVNNLKTAIDSVMGSLTNIFTSFSTLFGYVGSSVNTIVGYLGSTNYTISMIQQVFDVIPSYITAICVLAFALTLGLALIRK